MDTDFLARVFGAMFAIMNPFVSLPIFLSLTDGDTSADMRRTALAATFYSAVMCVVVAVGGQALLKLFGITVNDFRVAGGLVLLLIGLGMLNGHENTAHHGTPAEKAQQPDGDNVAFYPMAFPMIVGPGTITTLLIFIGEAKSPEQYASVAVATAVVLAVLAVVLYFAAQIGHLLSQTLRVIMTRLMGMILAAIAAAMITDGLKALLPGLG